MCELFGASAKDTRIFNDDLKAFYKHSCRHPHGWGLALLDGDDAAIEKEPKQASFSEYLKNRLTEPIEERTVLAHIRYATIGNLEYSNCHPFTGKDRTDRRWTQIHNGTIFSYDPLSVYTGVQKGDTDSERIFLHVLDLMNRAAEEKGELDEAARFSVLEKMTADMAPGNKLNLMIYDGEYLYVHTNCEGTLYYTEGEDEIRIATVPYSREEWKPVPMTTLLAIRDGKIVRSGQSHGHTYRDDPEQIARLYQMFSNL